MSRPELFAPFRLGSLTIRNRVMMSPMSQNSASAQGEAQPWHMVHYGARAVGGCGLVMMEDTAVLEEGRISGTSLGLYDDRQVTPLARIVDFCRGQGASVGIQIAHAGRKAFKDRKGRDCDLLSSGTGPFHDGWAAPRAVTEADVARVVAGFAEAARRAARAGFDVVEIHAAHGYLLHQFLSPLTNTRADAYGGSSDNRERLLCEVVAAVRAVWPGDRVIFCRLPAMDGESGGLTAADVARIAARLHAAGVHAVDIGGSNLTRASGSVGRDAMRDAAAAIRAPTQGAIVLGGTESGEAAGAEVAARHCDMIAVGRPLLVDPYWALSTARAMKADVGIPDQYVLGFPKPAVTAVA